MFKLFNFPTILLSLTSILTLVSTFPQNKIHPELHEAFQIQPKQNIIISLVGDTEEILQNLNSIKFTNRNDRLNTVASTLKSHAESYSRNLLNFLSKTSFQGESFWITNEVFVQDANLDLITSISNFPEVTGIRREEVLERSQPVTFDPVDVEVGEGPSTFTNHTPPFTWGISKIQAYSAWNMKGGNNGTGVVVGGIDGGVRGTHWTLRHNFLGDYGWLDPIFLSKVPMDRDGHGTHTMGTAVGKVIGVAPASKWMACNGCGPQTCSYSHLIKCGQFMTCPTLVDGKSPNCTKAPHVINNSWASTNGGSQIYKKVIAAWRAAGIIPVFSIGNAGPKCFTVGSPGDNPGVISVGASTSSDSLAGFSGSGPTWDNRLSPDIIGPGVDIISAHNSTDTAYFKSSGTSMGAPHVSGTIALLLSAQPNLTFEEVRKHLNKGTRKNIYTTKRNCGGIKDTVIPNNAFGHGRVSAFEALKSLLSVS